MNKLEKLYERYHFRSPKKFVPIAIEHGFTKRDALSFLNTIPRDIKFTKQSELMLPIYGRHQGSYQFDTLIQSKTAEPRYFLIIININSRKLYAYPMNDKNTDSVHKALEDFVTKVKDVESMTSDQDHSYITDSMTNFFLSHHIDHQTTLANDHNRLGIINRAIKTLRDLNQSRDFTVKSMNRCLKAYNNSIHSSTQMKPNQFDKADEIEYIRKMDELTDSIQHRAKELKPHTHVRIIQDKTLMGKKRSNLTPNAYLIDSKVKNKYIIRAKDDSVAEYPRYRLVPDKKAKLASTIESKGKRAVIDHIESYNKKHYKVKYADGSSGNLTLKQMREGRPTKLSPQELEYWSKNKSRMPNDITAYLN